MHLGATCILAVVPLSLCAFAFTGSPDLTVIEVDDGLVSTDCATLEALGTVSATIENIGTAGSLSATAVFFEDRNGNGTYEAGPDLLLGDDTIPSLLPNEQAVVSTSVNATVLFAGNLIYAFADSDDDVVETDETNNYGNSGEDCLFEPPVGPFDPTEEWNWNSSTTLPEHTHVMMTPVVVNLTDDNGDNVIDEDDIPDVVFSTFARGAYFRDSVIRAVNGDDGTEIFTTPLTDDRDVLGEGSIAVGDIDGDGLPEIIAVEDISETHSIDLFGRLIVFEHDGTFKFTSDLMAEGRLRWGGAALADLNEDTTPEIIVGRQVLSNTGAILATGTSRRGDNGIGPLSTVADIDRDGKLDIVAGFTVYEVVFGTLDEIIGLDVKWHGLNAAGGVVPGDGFPGVANFDLDDAAEVVVVSTGFVWLFDDDGTWLWGPVAIPGGGNGGAPNIDDFDNDGLVEVGTAGGSQYVVYDTDGTVLWSSPTFDNSSNVTGSSVFDFEADGSAEVVYKDQTFLRVYRGTDGFILAEIPTGSGTTYENPVIADVDRDGNAEIIVCANDYAFGTKTGIQVFGDANDGWVNTRRIWNQHTYHITNVNDDGTIPFDEADNWLTFNNFRSQEGGDPGEIFGAPDLTVSGIAIDDEGCPNRVDVTAIIGNGGGNVVAPGINVAFYDGDPNAAGVLIGVVQTSQSLDPGEFEVVSLNVTPAPQEATTFCVVADDDGTGVGAENECDEDNNQCCAEFENFCAECFLVLGGGPGDESFLGGGYLFDTQLDGVDAAYEVLLTDYPEIPIPAGPALAGVGGVSGLGLQARYGWTFAAQVLMWNPWVFPQEPEQYSGGMLIRVTSNGELRKVQYGAPLGGVALQPEVRRNAQGVLVLAFPFTIEGF